MKIDLVGRRFGQVVVLENDHPNSNRVICRCDCGMEWSVARTSLTRKNRPTTRCPKCGQKLSGTNRRSDLTGKRFGRLVAETRIGTNKNGMSVWRCRCDCGSIKNFQLSSLITREDSNGHTRSCGCLQREQSSKRHTKDLLGQRFGRLVVIGKNGIRCRKVVWKCVCDCGNASLAWSGDLISGNHTSCGCYQAEIASQGIGNNLPPDIEDTLYVVRIKDLEFNEEYIKVGRTIHTVAHRFGHAQYKLLDIKILHQVKDQHWKIDKLEAELKQLRLDRRLTPFQPTRKIDGHTESYSTSELLTICEYIDTYFEGYNPPKSSGI